ncbi:hypothetical protein MRB53_040181 [Persea americana]|nr:hypothetical protein MRB53_040181 [Persea americana]
MSSKSFDNMLIHSLHPHCRLENSMLYTPVASQGRSFSSRNTRGMSSHAPRNRITLTYDKNRDRYHNRWSMTAALDQAF